MTLSKKKPRLSVGEALDDDDGACERSEARRSGAERPLVQLKMRTL